LITVIAEWILIRRGVVKSSNLNKVRVVIALFLSLSAIYLGWIGSIVPMIYWITSLSVLGIGFLCYPLFMRKMR